ncbi:hypothetical protein L3X38_010772 [Prunus dulcis]|uniref:Tripeptidyl peptidase II second Ig-like domain-containing protein n=1 Tax=Prunus dulcis TaxID=3755 RepID=A0AAD4WGU5_PRUDU|nr:hypothetical protein L3X38_010772 [Prunus dulcis]
MSIVHASQGLYKETPIPKRKGQKNQRNLIFRRLTSFRRHNITKLGEPRVKPLFRINIFHGIKINKDEMVLDGSEAPIRIEAEALNKIRIPYRLVESKLFTLPTDRAKLPSEKRVLALILTYKFKLEDGAEVKPQVPLLNNRVYDTKF